MTLRTQFLETHPDFPWLEAGDAEAVGRLLAKRGWLEEGESVRSADTAGDGNMNLTLRVRTDRRTMILKQARPWVEKYDTIAAPWDRVLFERRFYERIRSIPEVASRMPRLIQSDDPARVLLLEDLRDAADMSDVYSGKNVDAEEIGDLALYLAVLHRTTRGKPDPQFANREMRALNHEHIYLIPLVRDNGLDLEPHEPGLTQTAERLKKDSEYVALVDETGRRYLADGPCLLHGDFFPGSWLRTPAGPRVIDPEFCFHGDPEFDLGICVAHLALARQDPSLAETFLSGYARTAGQVPCDPQWIARFAAAETMRRLIGVAQLPIPPTRSFRSELLERSRRAMLAGSWEALWN